MDSEIHRHRPRTSVSDLQRSTAININKCTSAYPQSLDYTPAPSTPSSSSSPSSLKFATESSVRPDPREINQQKIYIAVPSKSFGCIRSNAVDSKSKGPAKRFRVVLENNTIVCNSRDPGEKFDISKVSSQPRSTALLLFNIIEFNLCIHLVEIINDVFWFDLFS